MSERASAAKTAPMAVMACAGAAVLMAYEMLRSTSASLFIKDFGAGNLVYALAAVPAVAATAIILFSRLLARMRARRTFLLSVGSSAALMAFLGLCARLGVPFTSAALYLFGQVYVVLLIGQIWSFVNSTLEPAQARRLNGMIIGIASLGSIGGGFLTGRYAARMGTENLLFLAAAVTLAALGPAAWAFWRAGEPAAAGGKAQSGWRGHFALATISQDRPLVGLIGLVSLSQAVSALLDVAFHRELESAYPILDQRTAFLGDFWGWLNAAGLLMQFLLTPLALRSLSLGRVHRGIPIVHAALAVLFLARPTLAVAAAAFALFKSLDYSLFGAAKEIFYIPLSYDARYRAKQVVDSLVYRGSKGATSVLLSVATALAGELPIRLFPAATLASAAAWLAMANWTARDVGERAKAC